MALPQDGQNANGLTKVTEIPKGKELIFVDPTTNEGGIITLEDLTKQILNNLTSQTFALDQGTMTLLKALNQLNSKLSPDGKIWFYASDFEQGAYNASGQKTNSDSIIRTKDMTDVAVGDTVHITQSDNQRAAISNYYDGSMHDLGNWTGAETEYTIDHAGKIIILAKKTDESQITPSEYVRQVYIMHGA